MKYHFKLDEYYMFSAQVPVLTYNCKFMLDDKISLKIKGKLLSKEINSRIWI